MYYIDYVYILLQPACLMSKCISMFTLLYWESLINYNFNIYIV